MKMILTITIKDLEEKVSFALAISRRLMKVIECGEHDGGTTPEDGSPYAKPVFYNATYIGRGIAAGTSRSINI